MKHAPCINFLAMYALSEIRLSRNFVIWNKQNRSLKKNCLIWPNFGQLRIRLELPTGSMVGLSLLPFCEVWRKSRKSFSGNPETVSSDGRTLVCLGGPEPKLTKCPKSALLMKPISWGLLRYIWIAENKMGKRFGFRVAEIGDNRSRWRKVNEDAFYVMEPEVWLKCILGLILCIYPGQSSNLDCRYGDASKVSLFIPWQKFFSFPFS